MLFLFCSRETLLHYGLWDQVRVDHAGNVKIASKQQYKVALCTDTVKTSK